MKPWTATDKLWTTLSANQRAVVISLMEADNNDPIDAKNVLAADQAVCECRSA